LDTDGWVITTSLLAARPTLMRPWKGLREDFLTTRRNRPARAGSASASAPEFSRDIISSTEMAGEVAKLGRLATARGESGAEEYRPSR